MGKLKVGKAIVKKGEDAVDYLFNKIKGEGPKKYLDENMNLIDDFAEGKKTLSQVKGDIRKGMQKEQKSMIQNLKEARESGYTKEYDAGRSRILKKKGGKVTKRPMGGKVYKVDNSGQDLVQKMYGGKIKK
jgi:hypothetical protein